ncbi:hypothetical protein BJ875DRAFT_487377 [Amylocarpus encephaloides]|uniref:NB-ARC domain-containing protein n=1 Tax=Amylocarpus encephaloides TaxID=45428 RepID=A0A9P7YDE0_9HELO|nr:hypothetical protein BJ875DRAFT_487377 [Amylocarpus encephaloides]
MSCEFFGPRDVFDSLDKVLGSFKRPSLFRSVALCGVDGIGKSTIAAEYVNAKALHDEYNHVFWVHGESYNSLMESFTDIALHLKIPDDKWILVFDNVESAEILAPFWVLSKYDKTIITTRKSSLSQVDTGIEVAPWDPETDTEFLISLLNSEIQGDFDAEAKAALRLSRALFGRPLMLKHMAGLANLYGLRLSELANMYLKTSVTIPGSAHETIWVISFRRLARSNTTALKLLSVMAFSPPNQIPRSLFETDLTDSFLEYLGILPDEHSHSFNGAIKDLRTLAILDQDKVTGNFFVYSAVLQELITGLPSENLQAAFDNATALLYHKFIKEEQNDIQFTGSWNQSNEHTQHVPHFQHFKESLEVTTHHKDDMPVEHARNYWRLSQALNRVPDKSGSDEARRQGERCLKQRLRAGEDYGRRTRDVYDYFIPVQWR